MLPYLSLNFKGDFMDHGDNDKRFYVYLHKDKDGNVRYVGSGSHSRIVSNSSRTKEHLELWPELEKG